MNELAALIRLEDPQFYLDDPYPILQRMRQEDPVFYYEPLDMWVMSKYDDIRHVGGTPSIFSNYKGINWGDFQHGGVTKAFFPADAENIALLDPPRHAEIRNIISPAFSPRIVAVLRDSVREMCRDLLAPIKAGTPVNWSEQVAEPLPLMVIAILLGMPLKDLGLIKYYSDEVIKIGASLTGNDIEEITKGLAPMYEYFEERLCERDQNPTDDLLTTLQQARKSGMLSSDTVHMLIAGVMTAGNETTRNTINGAIILLSQHPDQMALLAAQPELVKTATEEFLRYVSPVRGFGRTVVQDTEVRGRKLSTGQHVFNMFMSGNRDEAVFEEPETFNIARQRNKVQLAFGFGEHFCIGAALARMEINVLFEELIARFSTVKLVAPAHRHKVLQFNMWSDITAVFG